MRYRECTGSDRQVPGSDRHVVDAGQAQGALLAAEPGPLGCLS
jgi:hypothetical protein